MPATEFTRLNRKWYLKLIIFLVVLVFFGFYGLYDATIAYPARGRRVAEFQLKQYLELCDAAGVLETRASVPDPVAELDALRAQERELRAAVATAGASASDAQIRLARLEWLRALRIVGDLDPAHTVLADPRARLAELAASLANRNPPKKLSAYDIPVQWVFVVVGLGGGLWIGTLIFAVSRRKFGWDPAEQRLYLPDGSSIVPADVADFDKRKWDKFLVFLRIKPGHERHAGKELRLDLLRVAPLEAWVLTMERTAFPERAASEARPPEPPGAGPPPPESPAPAA